MPPEFSVILPTRGDSPHLRLALESALAATGDVQVIVVHDRRANEPPILATPQEEGVGGIIQGHLEGSNVEPVRELVDLIFTQRGFELNSQSIQSADEALRVVANLRR